MNDEYQLMEAPETSPRPDVPTIGSRRREERDSAYDAGGTDSPFAQGLKFLRSLKPVEWLKLHAVLGGGLGGAVSLLLYMTGMLEGAPLVAGVLGSSALAIIGLVVVIASTVTAFGYVAINMPVKFTVCFLVAIFYAIGVGATTLRDNIFEILNASMLFGGVGAVVGCVVAFWKGKVGLKDLFVSDDDDHGRPRC